MDYWIIGTDDCILLIQCVSANPKSLGKSIGPCSRIMQVNQSIYLYILFLRTLHAKPFRTFLGYKSINYTSGISLSVALIEFLLDAT